MCPLLTQVIFLGGNKNFSGLVCIDLTFTGCCLSYFSFQDYLGHILSNNPYMGHFFFSPLQIFQPLTSKL